MNSAPQVLDWFTEITAAENYAQSDRFKINKINEDIDLEYSQKFPEKRSQQFYARPVIKPFITA